MIKGNLKYIFNKENMLPIQLFVMVTSRCNLRCKTCFTSSQKSTSEELSLAEMQKIGSNFNKLMWVIFGGGEPFLREELPEIARAFNTTALSIPTNGMLTEKIYSDTRKILDTCSLDLFNLCLSIDGIGDVHNNLRQHPDSFANMLRTAELVTPLLDKYDNFGINVNTVISAENQDHIEEIISFVEKNIKVNVHSFELLRGSPRDHSMRLPDPHKLKHIIELIKETYRKRGYYDSLGNATPLARAGKILCHDYIHESLRTNKRVLPCYAGRISGSIDAFGNVYQCELLTEPIGSLREAGYDFQKIWLSPTARRKRDVLRDTCFCTHSCIMLTNIVFNPRTYPKLFSTYLKFYR